MQNFNPPYARFVEKWKTQEIKIRDEHLSFYIKPLNQPSSIIIVNPLPSSFSELYLN